METVDILARVDAVDELRGIAAIGQRQLHQDAVDSGVGVEPVDQRQQFGIAGIRRQVEVDGADTDLFRRSALVAHVHAGSRVAADQHHRQAWTGLARSDACVDLRLQVVEQILGNALAIEDAGVGRSRHGHGEGRC